MLFGFVEHEFQPEVGRSFPIVPLNKAITHVGRGKRQNSVREQELQRGTVAILKQVPGQASVER